MIEASQMKKKAEPREPRKSRASQKDDENFVQKCCILRSLGFALFLHSFRFALAGLGLGAVQARGGDRHRRTRCRSSSSVVTITLSLVILSLRGKCWNLWLSKSVCFNPVNPFNSEQRNNSSFIMHRFAPWITRFMQIHCFKLRLNPLIVVGKKVKKLKHQVLGKGLKHCTYVQVTLRGFRTGAGLAQRPVVFVELAKAHGNSSTSIHRAHGLLAHPFAIASVFFFQMCVWLIWRLPGDHGFDQQLLPLCLSFRPHEPREPAGLVRPDFAWPHWQVSQHLGETSEEPYTILYIYMYLIYTYKFMFISSFETRWENGVMQGGLMEFDVRIHIYI